jgi:hypothetical protein
MNACIRLQYKRDTTWGNKKKVTYIAVYDLRFVSTKVQDVLIGVMTSYSLVDGHQNFWRRRSACLD